MRNLLLLATLLVVGATTLMAQEETEEKKSNWTTGGNASFTFNQISFKNWASGGKNSLAGTFLFKTFANYKSEKTTWDNTLDLGYGLTKYAHEDYQKSEDKIQFSSTYGYDAAKGKWFYSASVDFKTQFAKGYDYSSADTAMVSKAFSPAYVNLALGMLYKPNDIFSLFISPVTGKMTIVGDTILSTNYGLDEGEKVRGEYGASAKITVNKKDLLKNVDYYLTGNFFSNLCDHPEHIDCDVETGFNFTINEYLSALIKVNLLFDDDIKYQESYIDADGNAATRERGARAQWKELFGFGLAFKW